jgi:hypothetical protein
VAKGDPLATIVVKAASEYQTTEVPVAVKSGIIPPSHATSLAATEMLVMNRFQVLQCSNYFHSHLHHFELHNMYIHLL